MAKNILQHDVYWTLRHEIITWKRAPGQALVEETLAREFHVSRTPLREALRRLAEEDLVRYEPHKGARVALWSPGVVRDIFLVREALEGIAGREAATRIEGNELARFRDRYESLRRPIENGNLEDVGDDLHALIFNACGSDRLRKTMSVIMGQVRWAQHVAEQSPARLLRSFREHESILSSLELRDPVPRENASRAHVRSVLAYLVEMTAPAKISSASRIA